MKNIYSIREKLKLTFVVVSVVIVGLSAYATSRIVHRISQEECVRMTQLAEATKNLVEAIPGEDISFELHLIEGNTTIPVVIVDENDIPVGSRNLKLPENDSVAVAKIIKRIKAKNQPIEISFASGEKQFIYYDDSILKRNITYFAIIQALVVIIFIAISGYIVLVQKKAEQDRIWVGLSRETAHQLGTPITSLMAWMEILKDKKIDVPLLTEMSKDVDRLHVIADRFSKIGSIPDLTMENLNEVLEQSVSYMRKRVSRHIGIDFSCDETIDLPLNKLLFSWVIENLCKNAVDAMMDGEGEIRISAKTDGDSVVMDVADTGKGISKSHFRTIFNPGYTTKKRGWGLGLSLVRRIVEEYHRGKIFVKKSEIGHGTTFRIVLPLRQK